MAREHTITDLPPGGMPGQAGLVGAVTDNAMARAVALAERGVGHGPNPRVGCVITDHLGVVLGEGWHRGAGTVHAEVAALADARGHRRDVGGAVAFVTLEPCSHTGRMGPCTQALIEAGITAVRYAVEDPNPNAAGGGKVLRDAGVDAVFVPHEGAAELNVRWLVAMRIGRPYVIAKWAATLDGRTAAVDGTSFWITGEESRAHAHVVRGQVDAIVVGTGTVAIDDPSLSARAGSESAGSESAGSESAGSESARGDETGHQPLRVVMGLRDTAGKRVWRDGNAIAARTHDPAAVLADLHRRQVRVVLVEGGSTVTTAFLAAGLVDEIHAYIAPAILGAGTSAVGDLGITAMSGALRGTDASSLRLGADTLVIAHVAEGN